MDKLWIMIYYGYIMDILWMLNNLDIPSGKLT